MPCVPVRLPATNTAVPSAFTAMRRGIAASLRPPGNVDAHSAAPSVVSYATVHVRRVSIDSSTSPVTKSRDPSGLTATASAKADAPPDGAVRVVHSRVPVDASYATTTNAPAELAATY